MKFSDFIPIVVALVTILPTLITVLNAILQNSGHQRVNLINLTNVKTIQVKHVPLTENYFKKLRNQYFYNLLLFIAIFVIFTIYPIYVYYQHGFYYLYYYFNWSILIIEYVILTLMIIYLNHKVITMDDAPNDARFLIFEKIIIEFEADFTVLFDYLIYVLYFMKAYKIEFNKQDQTIKAVARFGLYFFIIHLSLLKVNKKTIHLTVDCERVFHYPSIINKWIDKSLSLSYTGKPEMKSAIMNNFVKIAVLDPIQANNTSVTENILLKQKRSWLYRLLRRG